MLHERKSWQAQHENAYESRGNAYQEAQDVCACSCRNTAFDKGFSLARMSEMCVRKENMSRHMNSWRGPFSLNQPVLVLALPDVLPLFTVKPESLQHTVQARLEQQSPCCQGGHA